jgi:phosphohistidine phosphatase
MQVYLVQHGKAHGKDVDPERSLTKKGREETVRVAKLAGRMNLDVYQIRHSGKTRAEETAAILAQRLSPPGGVVQVTGLAPLDDVAPIGEGLGHAQEQLMLVGHLPFMARLAGLLVVGDPQRDVVSFRNSGIVCLTGKEDRWQVAWILTPEMAGV